MAFLLGQCAISSKVFNEIFKNVFLAERWGRWLLWLKISIAQKFWFCNSNATHFPTARECKNFNFSLYTVPAEMLYLQKYSTNFQKLFFGRTMRKVAIVVKNFNCTEVWFCNGNVTTFPTSGKCKNFNFSLYTVAPEMLYLQKYLTWIFKNVFFGRMIEEGGYCGWKLQMHRCFGFAITTLQLFQHPENVKISIFPFTLSPAKMPCLQKCLTNFQKLSFGWKMRKVAIVVENF